MTLGEIIRRRREDLGLTQEEFGSQFGKPQTYVSKVESDRICPPPQVLYWIGLVLEMDPLLLEDSSAMRAIDATWSRLIGRQKSPEIKP